MNIILYTKPGCHLCEEAKAILQGLAVDYPHQLEEIDIRETTAVHNRYWDKIPVIQLGDHQIQAPIQHQDVVNLLKANSQ